VKLTEERKSGREMYMKTRHGGLVFVIFIQLGFLLSELFYPIWEAASVDEWLYSVVFQDDAKGKKN
jgi:hypothetical protein